MNNENALTTNAVDLFAPASRFASASKIHAQMHRWWLLFRRYWWLVVLIFLCVLVPIFLYTFLTGPTFKSTASMWLTGKIAVSNDYGYTEQLVDFLGTQAALLSSPEIQRQAYAMMLAKYGPPGGTNLIRTLSAPTSVSSGANQIPFSVKVDQGDKSSTLSLACVGRDALGTQHFLACVMQAFLNFKKQASDQAAEQAAESLTAEAAQLKKRLAATQAELQAFEASNNVVFLQQQGTSAQSFLASLNQQLAVLRTESKLLDSIKPEEWTQTDPIEANAANPNSGDNPADQQKLAALQQSQTALFQADQQMHLLMAQRTELSKYLRPAHPKIIQLNRQIAQQQEIVQVARNEVATQLSLRRQALQLQIKNLQAATAQWDVRALIASRKMDAYNQIQQNIQRLQTAYDQTFNLIQNVDVGQRMDQADVGILDPASKPRPTFRMLIHMALAVGLALLLSFGMLYGIALFQDNFASPIELAEYLSEPVLGQIPSIAMKQSRNSPGMDELEQQRYEFLEAFRNIRASLLFMNNGGTPPKTMVVTSSIPEEGKSTVALYLAATLARGNSNVLLVDGDMRRPSLHKYFGIPKGPGLAELLDNESTFANVLASGVKNLAILRAGLAKRNPGDLVLSPVWPEFLKAARQQFDYILVDTPPVAATDDAAALAPKTDGVLFIVRALSTSARVARDALNLVRQRQAHVVGLIFNGAATSPYERSYYQSYARGYHWKEDKSALGGVLPAGNYDPQQPA